MRNQGRGETGRGCGTHIEKVSTWDTSTVSIKPVTDLKDTAAAAGVCQIHAKIHPKV